MWFGDLVTMKWWDDLWLNESFAEWAAHHSATRATKYTEAWTGFTNARKNWAYRQDQLPTTHPVAADNHDLFAVEVNFDGITYAKGASVLKQLVAWVGEAEFLQGLRSYFQQHAFGNSEFTDLLAALEESSGRQLAGWAHEWLQTSGVNTLAPEFDVDDSGRFTSFRVRQTAPVEHPELRRHRIGIGLYDLRDGHLVRRSHSEVDVAGSVSDVAELLGQEQPDLLLLNDGDLTYAKIRLDERSLATLVEHIDKLDDSLARALCWGAAWDMTRDAEMAARDFATLVLRGVGTETDLVAVGALLRYATQAVDQYSAPATRAEIREAWERGLRRLVEEAAPGSDHQLALVRSLALNARTEESLDRIAALYDSSQPLDGLEVSTDLRWVLLTSLAAGGRANDSMIQAQLEQDHTISGQERAAAAQAVQPTAEAKERAWHDAAERDDVPNETQRSIAGAFQVAGQEDVLEPFVDRYLHLAETVWETKGSNGAQVMLTLLFPRTAPTQELLDKVQSWIDATNANPGSVRYVREGADDLRRALAAQAKDASLDG
jgi:aminopeptidase N